MFKHWTDVVTLDGCRYPRGYGNLIPMNYTLRMYNKLQAYPLGKSIFTKIICRTAPYFGSMRPFVNHLDETSCEVILKKRKSIQNHIGTVHAIAMCNACELAMGMVFQAGLPQDLRWIPKGMSVRYLKKAGTDLRALCKVLNMTELTPGDHIAHVDVYDKNNEIVMDADINIYVSEKKKRTP